MIAIKNVFLIEDLSSLNSISLNVATPIVASFGLRALPIPVQIFTTQSESDEEIQCVSSIEWLHKTLESAHRQFKKQLNYGLVGYLGKEEIITEILHTRLLDDLDLLLVDPVMADEGKYYPMLNERYLGKLKELVKRADIITPNLTELAFLTGERYVQQPSLTQVKQQVQKLHRMSKKDATIIVTGIEQVNQIGCLWSNVVSHGTFYLEKIPGHFYGTGDAFAAMLFSEMITQKNLAEIIPSVMKSLQMAVEDTLSDQNDLKLGIDITRILQCNQYRGE